MILLAAKIIIYLTMFCFHVNYRASFKTSPFEVCAYLPNICVPDERDLRFASTGSNFNPRNTTCIPVVNIFPFLDLEQISVDFEIEHF